MRNVRLRMWRRVVIGWQGVVRALAHHIVSTVAIRRLGHGWSGLVSSVVQVRVGELWAALLGWQVSGVWARWWWHRGHATARHERLCLRVECVTVEAPRNRVLALWVMGISIGRQSPVSIWNSWLGGWGGSRLVRALVESGRRDRRLLPSMLGLRLRLNRRPVRSRSHGIHGRLVARLTWRLRVLTIEFSKLFTKIGRTIRITYIHHIVILRNVAAARHDRCVWLVRGAIHGRHRSRVWLLGWAAVLRCRRNILGLYPSRLVGVSIRWCVGNVIGPSLEGIGIATPSCFLPAVYPVSHRHRARPRDTSAVVYLCPSVSENPEKLL